MDYGRRAVNEPPSTELIVTQFSPFEDFVIMDYLRRLEGLLYPNLGGAPLREDALEVVGGLAAPVPCGLPRLASMAFTSGWRRSLEDSTAWLLAMRSSCRCGQGHVPS